jgi:hypothetical protein
VGLEGIVLTAPNQPGHSRNWIKVKNSEARDGPSEWWLVRSLGGAMTAARAAIAFASRSAVPARPDFSISSLAWRPWVSLSLPSMTRMTASQDTAK